MTKGEIIQIVQPSPEELWLFDIPEIVQGLSWGKPRPGHPEGLVVYHVAQIFRNIDEWVKESPGRNQYYGYLRLLAIVHDAYKYAVDKSLPKHGENHHGMIARRAMQGHVGHGFVLDIIELHDEVYNAYRKGLRSTQAKAHARAEILVQRIGSNMELYLAFCHVDNAKGDKHRPDLDWFTNFVRVKYPHLMNFENARSRWAS